MDFIWDEIEKWDDWIDWQFRTPRKFNCRRS